MHELTGLPPDEDCLHCYLPPIIEAWVDAHPQVERQMLLIQLAQVLGEMIGSAAPDAVCADRMSVGILRYVRLSAREIAHEAPPGEQGH